jgi:transcriptional regulator with XRE-family HTH domain
MEKLSLKALRVNAGLSQEGAAKELSVSTSTLGNWESGKSFPKQPNIEKLCKLYNCTYDSIDFLA